MIAGGMFKAALISVLFAVLLNGCKTEPKPRPSPHVNAPTPPKLEEPRPTPSATEVTPVLKAVFTDEGIRLTLPWEGAEVWRSYMPISDQVAGVNMVYNKVQGTELDDPAPHGVDLYYLARSPQGEVVQCQLPAQPDALKRVRNPRIHVDKDHYTLTVYEGDRVAKRYPIALGANPTNRKFCQDNASTPEGLYRIYNLQPQATFYRAFDIDYPNRVDHIRHELAIKHGEIESSRSIGGEIQIHGQGITYNWTHGCMALRNEDMDELFAHAELGVNLEVFITGSQISLEDRSWLLQPDQDYVKEVQRRLGKEGFYKGSLDGDFGDGTARALGQFQHKHGLAVSCQLDRHTREFLGQPGP